MKHSKIFALTLCITMLFTMICGLQVSAADALINNDYENIGYMNLKTEDGGKKDWTWSSVSDGFLIMSVSFMQPQAANTRIHQVWSQGSSKGSRPYVLYTFGDSDRQTGHIDIQVNEKSYNIGKYKAGEWNQIATIVDVSNKKIYAYLNGQLINPSVPFEYYQDVATISSLQMQTNGESYDTYIDRVYVDRFHSLETAKAALMTQTMINDSTDAEFSKSNKNALSAAAAPYLSTLREGDNAEAIAGLNSVTDSAIPKIRKDLFGEDFEECTVGSEPTKNKVVFAGAEVVEETLNSGTNKAVRIDGKNLKEDGVEEKGRYTIAYKDASGNNKSISENVTISFKLKQCGNNKYPTDRIAAATDSDGKYVAYEVRSNGSDIFMHSYDENKKLITLIPNYDLDTWYKFDMNIDFASKTINAYVDDAYIGTVPFSHESLTGVCRIMDLQTYRGTYQEGGIYLDDIYVHEEIKGPDFAIGNSSFKDAGNNALSKMTAGGRLDSTYVHKNAAGSAQLISAVYNKDGSLMEAAISDVSAANAGERVNVNVNLALGDSMDGVSVKQFLWNDNMQVLSKNTYRTANTEGTKIFLLGDSTVCNYDPAVFYPQAGWGQMLGNYLSNVTINNYATPGYTLKRTYNEGILDRVLSEGNPGDYVMLQFAHNDSKIEKDTEYVDAIKEYRAWLKVYAERVMAKGMNPIFVTSPVRRVNGSFGGDSILASYSDSMKSVGRALNVPVIDLFTESKRLVDCYDSGAAVDGADSTALYLYLSANDTRYFGEGSAYTGSVYNSTTPTADNTHFCEYGADVMAGIVAEGLENIGNELSDKVDTTHIPVMP